MVEGLEDLKAHITEALGAAINGADISFDELTIHARREEIVKTIVFLRDDLLCKFTTLIDICGADYPERERRFDVVYHMLSMQLNQRIRIKITTDEDTAVHSLPVCFPMPIGMSAKPLICTVSPLTNIQTCAAS